MLLLSCWGTYVGSRVGWVGTVDSNVVRQRTATLEALFHESCACGEGIRLQFLEDNAGSLRVTLRQIKTAMRAAMRGINRDNFVMTFKRNGRFIIPHKANNPNFRGDRNCHHALMTVDQLNKLK